MLGYVGKERERGGGVTTAAGKAECRTSEADREAVSGADQD